MAGIARYVMTLTAAALLSGILLSLFPEGTIQSILRLCCGVFLTVTALSPLPGLQLPDLRGYVQDYQTQGQAIAAQGQLQAEENQLAYIKQALEAYILDKAEAVNADVQAEVTVDAQGMPQSVVIYGAMDEAVRQQLGEVVTKDLGIPEENQQWIQENESSGSGNGS